MASIPNPIICEINYNSESSKQFNELAEHLSPQDQEYLFEYPTVYIINSQNFRDKYDIYVGETSNINLRTMQHLSYNSINEAIAETEDPRSQRMYVVGHRYFNKSLTLDIENKLMHYLSTIPSVDRVYNRRTNQQNKYYTSEYFEDIFNKVWRELTKRNAKLFPIKSVIEDSALFKASPFHKLTKEQIEAKEKIYSKVIQSLGSHETGQLVLVSGEAGSGKTVLMSSLFYDLNQELEELPLNGQVPQIHLVVNHDAQLTVYQEIARKLGISTANHVEPVLKPTRLINQISPDTPVDVVIVDEAHLLLTQGNQGYQGKNQLYDLLNRARVVIAVFDLNQILSTDQYWEKEQLDEIKLLAEENDNYIFLKNQMRIAADPKTVDWIRTLVDEQIVRNIPLDEKGYEIQVFDSANQMHQAIKEKAQNQDCGISRVVATFDWPYVDRRKPEGQDYWTIKTDDLELPWNYQLSNADKTIKNKNLSWAERPHTINEAGSTYTVQGFDLNYVGVIIGPSVKYREGKIIFDRSATHNRKVRHRRTLSDGSKEYLADFLLKNELNVLLTRGIHGLYIYAVDPELQAILLKAQRGEIEIGQFDRED